MGKAEQEDEESDRAGLASRSKSMGSCSVRPSQPDHHFKICMAPRASPATAFYYLFATHHLLARSKQADLRTWSKELGLVGLAKRGYPGIILLTAVDDGAQDRLGDVAQRVKVRTGGRGGLQLVSWLTEPPCSRCGGHLKTRGLFSLSLPRKLPLCAPLLLNRLACQMTRAPLTSSSFSTA